MFRPKEYRIGVLKYIDNHLGCLADTPSCTREKERRVVERVCMVCGRPPAAYTKDFHTCEDGRRGAFLWAGPENDNDVDQNASQV